MKKRIELLAPAGNRDALHAAVENGADAVYLGGKLFNARQQADNFEMDELKEELRYAHARGVNVYLTMNTLVSDDEMRRALIYAIEAGNAGIDAIIVQDPGLARALRIVLPDMPLHASTQMTIYDLDGVRTAESMGFRRVVLARELTLREASGIARNTSLEIEIFIHGALCVCYSGQCLMSSMIGGRSGNRGNCAQPCRLPYRISGCSQNAGYLLSPKDMCSLEHIGEIVTSGVHSLKIEGRMKSPEYVATVVRIYRKYLDIAMDNLSRGRPAQPQIDEADMRDLLQVYNRGGFSAGYLMGKTGADMMSYERPNNSGIYLGDVIAYDRRTQAITIRLETSLSIGDGVEIWAGGSDSPGGTVTSIKKGGKSLRKAGKGDIVEAGSFKGEITCGKKVYKTTDIELSKAARDTFSGKIIKKIEIKGTARLKAGQPLVLKVEDSEGHTVAETGTVLSEIAVNRPLTEERLKEQLAKTGSTPFIFTGLRVEMEDGLAIPISEINKVRRNALDRLLNLRADRYANLRGDAGLWAGAEERINEVLRNTGNKAPGLALPGNISFNHAPRETPAIALYFYKWEPDIDYADLGADRVYIPFAALDKPETAEILSALKKAGVEVFGWVPAIARGNWEKLINIFIDRMSSGCPVDGVLTGNVGTLRKFRNTGLRLAGDISLNLFNALSVEEAAGLGLESVTVSAELALKQIIGMAGILNARHGTSIHGADNSPKMPALEAVAYGRLPLMISEYCPVGCVGGGFKTFSPCSRICSKAQFSLRDRMGKEFPVMCDRIDCRSIILNSEVLFVPDVLKRLGNAGIGTFRLYIWDEPPELAKELVKLYRASIRDENGLAEYKDIAERIRASGYTKGHYFRQVK